MSKKHPIPRHITGKARKLWKRLREDFEIDDMAGISLLQNLCEAFMRVQESRIIIETEGSVILDRFQQKKAHPAVSIERDARSQMIAATRALRLSPEDI